MKKKATTKPKGLTAYQLVAKYDNGGKVDFDRALQQMFKTPSQSALSKQKNRVKNLFRKVSLYI